MATWCEELTHLKRPWCRERLKAGGERDDRGWNGWMASPTRWTQVWVNSGSWWWTGRPSVLQSLGSQSWTQLSDWTEGSSTRSRLPSQFPGQPTWPRDIPSWEEAWTLLTGPRPRPLLLCLHQKCMQEKMELWDPGLLTFPQGFWDSWA